MKTRLTDVRELSRFELGQHAWWVVLRPIGRPNGSPEQVESWMHASHPKVLFDRGIMSNLWTSKKKIPRLHAADFKLITELMTQDVRVEEFVVETVERSEHTGEFHYDNVYGEQMPEQSLFATRAAAVRERERLRELICEWLGRW